MEKLESLQSIFKDRLFRIPDYQRGYAWKVEQLKEFWDDAVNLQPERKHYTGVLSLRRVKKEIWVLWNEDRWLIDDQDVKPFYVVDGQQRLTTFVVFIQALSEFLRHKHGVSMSDGDSDDKIYIGSYTLQMIREQYLVVQKLPHKLVSSYKFLYETDNPSSQFLKYRIFEEGNAPALQETLYTANLEFAKSFFSSNLEEHFQKVGETGVELLFKKITQNLMFNLYEIDDDFNVFVAFETMNNRGKQLSKLELLKNRLIYLSTLYDVRSLELDEQQELRDKINESWKEVYYQLGKNKAKPLNDDDYLKAHWILYFKYSRKKGDDYVRFLLQEQFTPEHFYSFEAVTPTGVQPVQEIKDDFEYSDNEDEEDEAKDNYTSSTTTLSPSEIGQYVDGLKTAARHWYNSFNAKTSSDLTPEEGLWIDRLDRIGIMYFRPLVIASFLASKVSADERIRLFESIERFIFIAFKLCKASSSFGSSEFYRAARLLRIGKTSVDEIVGQLNDDLSAWMLKPVESSDYMILNHENFWQMLKKAFEKGKGFFSWNALPYFLYEYEMEKQSRNGNPKIDWQLFVKTEKDKVSIEHIYPQTGDKQCWKASFGHFTDAQRTALCNSLGNLMPLSMSINSSLQNDCFLDKRNAKVINGKTVRRGYVDGSHSEIEVAKYPDWNPQTIYERGELMLDFLERRWKVSFKDKATRNQLLFLDFVTMKDGSPHQDSVQRIG